MKLRVLSDARFTCQCCTNCCRGWHVELLAGEKERLENLKWPAGDPLAPAPTMLAHAGKTYLPKQADGACVYLNASNGLCRIHEQFGLEIKPLGCQLYPFRIVPTFEGEASVTFRYDCPTVRKNEGAPAAESLAELKRFAQKLVLPDEFDQQVCGSFDREQITAVCEFVGTLINGFDRNDQRAVFIIQVCDWLHEIAPGELDRPRLAEMFGELKKRVMSALAGAARLGRGPNLLHRVAFRTLLGIYLRRDEDVLNGHAGRLGRLASMFALVVGFGGFAGLGISHPKGTLRRAKLFAPSIPQPNAKVSALHWRMIRAKLESFQFMGSANPGHDFLAGLRSLALLYPLVLAAARYRAGNRGTQAIDESDIDYAVGAIEHSFGRGAMLRLPFARSLERFLLETETFCKLV
jgi:Fe-S-cluster containining protein